METTQGKKVTHWSSLDRELDRWLETSRTACLWWRDDDADRPGESLRRLLRIGEQYEVTVAIAVPPALADSSLGEIVGEGIRCTVLQHGYAHINHAAPEKKKCELGVDRPLQTVLDELDLGIGRMRRMFGEHFLPVMVPPWNRIGEAVLTRLSHLGFTGISTYLPRSVAVDHGLQRCNTHVDIIDWRNQQRFVGMETAVDLLVSHLSAKRLGQADPGEPTGVLTHHLQHDEECWKFLHQLLAFSKDHPAVNRLSPASAFQA